MDEITPNHSAFLHITIHREDGGYWTEVQEHPGCFASGDDLAEVLAATEEAIRLGGWIETQ